MIFFFLQGEYLLTVGGITPELHMLMVHKLQETVQDLNMHLTVLTFFESNNIPYCRCEKVCYINAISVMMVVEFGMRHMGRWLHSGVILSIWCNQCTVHCI
jgi:hypothetical protein